MAAMDQWKSSALLVACTLLAGSSGCAGTQLGPAAVSQGSLLLYRSEPPRTEADKQLAQELAKRLKLRQVNAPPKSSNPSATPMIKNIRASLKRGQTLYQTMKFVEAQRVLQRALDRVERSSAAGLAPGDLAQIQLYLAALAQAQKLPQVARRHFAAAVSFDPQIQPDPDAFSPIFRNAVEQAKKDRKSSQVIIASKPAGAKVSWDGRELEQVTPVTIADQGLGEHYLRLSHPLYQRWQDRIRVSDRARLEIQLKPLSEPELLERASRNPLLRPRVVKTLAADIAWLLSEGENLVLELHPKEGPQKRFAFAADADSAQAAQVAVRVARSLGNHPTDAPARRPMARSSFLRRTWWIWTGAAALVVLGVSLPFAASQ